VPSQERFRCDDEGSPVLSRQQAARRRQEQSVDRRHRRTLRVPTQDGQFVPEHGDFQLFDIVRAPTPNGQRQDATKEEVAEEE
jgi:hypothetical protein